MVTKDLVDLNDDWLTTNAGRGSTADLLSHIQILCAQLNPIRLIRN